MTDFLISDHTIFSSTSPGTWIRQRETGQRPSTWPKQGPIIERLRKINRQQTGASRSSLSEIHPESRALSNQTRFPLRVHHIQVCSVDTDTVTSSATGFIYKQDGQHYRCNAADFLLGCGNQRCGVDRAGMKSPNS